MGNFYTNVTLKGADRALAIATLKAMKRTAFVSPQARDMFVVYDQQGDGQDGSHVDVAQAISSACHCVALAVLNHDDDILMYVLFKDGKELDAFNSNPDCFEETGDARGGNAETIGTAFGVLNKTKRVREILEDQDELFALTTHSHLIDELGLPKESLALGFKYLEGGAYYPDGMSADDFERVG